MPLLLHVVWGLLSWRLRGIASLCAGNQVDLTAANSSIALEPEPQIDIASLNEDDLRKELVKVCSLRTPFFGYTDMAWHGMALLVISPALRHICKCCSQGVLVFVMLCLGTDLGYVEHIVETAPV